MTPPIQHSCPKFWGMGCSECLYKSIWIFIMHCLPNPKQEDWNTPLRTFRIGQIYFLSIALTFLYCSIPYKDRSSIEISQTLMWNLILCIADAFHHGVHQVDADAPICHPHDDSVVCLCYGQYTDWNVTGCQRSCVCCMYLLLLVYSEI